MSEAVEDRHFTKAEYDALSTDAKRELAAKCLKRGHKPGAKDSRVTKGAKAKEKTKDSNAEVIKNLKAVKRSVLCSQSRRQPPQLMNIMRIVKNMPVSCLQ